MALASGVAKQLRIKKETTYGVLPGASSAKLLRRVESDLSLSKDSYQSSEKRTDYQVADMRHGVRRVAGTIRGELSAGTYADFLAAALRRAFTAVSDITGLSLTITASGSDWIIDRSTGSWISDGVKIGEVRRITAGAFNAANLNKNLIVKALTADEMTVTVLNGSALVAEGPIASATVSLPGKKTYAPETGHTDDSFTIEHFFSDIGQSECFVGSKVNSVDIDLPATGMSTVSFGMMGKDMVPDDAAYFTSPTAATSTGTMAAVNGVLLLAGNNSAICTGASVRLAGGYGGDPVVGSNTIPNVFPGRILGSGQFSAYFEDGTLRDKFVDETEMSLILILSASNAKDADFISIVLPRIKLKSAGKNDPDNGIVQTFEYEALRQLTGDTSDLTTLMIQDSAA